MCLSGQDKASTCVTISHIHIPHPMCDHPGAHALMLVRAVLGVCGFVLAWMKFHRDEDDVEDAAKSTKAWRV